jgi:hypothetical protein
VRHASGAECRHPIKKHAAVRIAGRDEASIAYPEIALFGNLVDHPHFLERLREIQFEYNLSAPAAEAVTVSAVHMQVTA